MLDALIAAANRDGRPVAEKIRHHLLDGVLRRLPVPDAPELVLRGSLVTRRWAGDFPRISEDLDLLGTFPHSVEAVSQRILPHLGAELPDRVRFDLRRCTAKAIWADTAFPGVRLVLVAEVLGETQRTTVDVGFGDPLVPPAERIDHPWTAGGSGPVWEVHPATLVGWKLHGLAEWGPTRWRPKDLLDLWLLTRPGGPDMPDEVLAAAIEAAFRSRGCEPSLARRTLDAPSWRSPPPTSRWHAWRSAARLPAPDLAAVRDEVAARLAGALAILDRTAGA